MAPNEEIKTSCHHDPSSPFDMFLGNTVGTCVKMRHQFVVFSWSAPVPWGRAAAHRTIDHQCIVIVAFALRWPPFF